MALVMARDVPASSTVALAHGPASIGTARRRLRRELYERRVCDTVVDDAVLILSELLTNACRHARPLVAVPGQIRGSAGDGTPRTGGGSRPPRPTDGGQDGGGEDAGGGAGAQDSGGVLVSWHIRDDGLLALAVTDGGGPTRPCRASPSLTARGGRGLGIVHRLALEWGVRDRPGEVTVWAVLPVRGRHARRAGATAENAADAAPTAAQAAS